MPQGYLAIIVSMLIWGSVGIFARKAGRDPLVTVTYRVLFGALALGVLEVAQRLTGRAGAWAVPAGRAKAAHLALLVFSGLALAANWLFFFKAVATTSVTNAVLSYYAAPVIVAMAAPLLLRERLERKTVVATILAFGGVFVMLYQPGYALSSADVAGIGYGLTAAAFYAMVTITGHWLRSVQATRLVLVQTLVASAVLLPAVALSPGLSAAMRSAPAGSIALLAVVGVVHTALALVLYFYGLRNAKVQYVGVLAYLDPVSAVLFALLFLGELPGLMSLLGGALVLGGSAVLLIPSRSGSDPAEAN